MVSLVVGGGGRGFILEGDFRYAERKRRWSTLGRWVEAGGWISRGGAGSECNPASLRSRLRESKTVPVLLHPPRSQKLRRSAGARLLGASDPPPLPDLTLSELPQGRRPACGAFSEAPRPRRLETSARLQFVPCPARPLKQAQKALSRNARHTRWRSGQVIGQDDYRSERFCQLAEDGSVVIHLEA